MGRRTPSPSPEAKEAGDGRPRMVVPAADDPGVPRVAARYGADLCLYTRRPARGRLFLLQVAQKLCAARRSSLAVLTLHPAACGFLFLVHGRQPGLDLPLPGFRPRGALRLP